LKQIFKYVLLLIFCVYYSLDVQANLICPDDHIVECTATIDPVFTGFATWNGVVTHEISFEDIYEDDCGETKIITRIWHASLGSTIVESCEQLIQTRDTTTPLITCPSNITVAFGEDTTSANTGFATGADSCGDVTITQSDLVAFQGTIGQVITRTWMSTDECGNQTSCDQIIKYTPNGYYVNGPLSIYCAPDITMSCRDFFENPLSAGEAAVAGGCSDPTQFFYTDEYSYHDTEVSIRRRWRVKDGCSTRSCFQEITLVDWSAPEIVCPEDIDLVDSRDIDPEFTGRLKFDLACGPVSVEMKDSELNTSNEFRNIIRTWTASNVLGQETSCKQSLRVLNLEQYISIAPNPAQEFILIRHIELDEYTVIVYNAQGQLMQSQQNSSSIDLSNLTAGLYYLSILSNKNVFARRSFIKK